MEATVRAGRPAKISEKSCRFTAAACLAPHPNLVNGFPARLGHFLTSHHGVHYFVRAGFRPCAQHTRLARPHHPPQRCPLVTPALLTLRSASCARSPCGAGGAPAEAGSKACALPRFMRAVQLAPSRPCASWGDSELKLATRATHLQRRRLAAAPPGSGGGGGEPAQPEQPQQLQQEEYDIVSGSPLAQEAQGPSCDWPRSDLRQRWNVSACCARQASSCVRALLRILHVTSCLSHTASTCNTLPPTCHPPPSAGDGAGDHRLPCARRLQHRRQPAAQRRQRHAVAPAQPATRHSSGSGGSRRYGRWRLRTGALVAGRPTAGACVPGVALLGRGCPPAPPLPHRPRAVSGRRLQLPRGAGAGAAAVHDEVRQGRGGVSAGDE